MAGPARVETNNEAPASLSMADAMADSSQLTPMMRQYLETKAQHPDTVLFFRLGDFYEMFFDDAIEASELLQITLTSRAKGPDRVPMCGVPYHSARRYIAKLIAHGRKVAICEQAEEAQGPGIVRREVVRIITPGMVLDEEVLESSENHFLLSLKPPAQGEDAWGAAWLEASTGEFTVATPGPLSELNELIAHSAPREVLLPESAREHPDVQRLLHGLSRKPSLATLPDAVFEAPRAWAYLKAHFQVKTLDGFGLNEGALALAPAAGAAAAALRYLKDTQKTEAPHVDRLSRVQRRGQLLLDDATIDNLELLRTLKDGSRKGSLLGVLDRTVTAMGARKLSRWLLAPLADVPSIELRLDAVEELSKKGVWREELSVALKGISDVERLCGRLAMGVGNARDLKALGSSIGHWPKVAALLEKSESSLLQMLAHPLANPALLELGNRVDRALVDEPPVHLKEGGLFQKGYHGELDTLTELSTSGKDYLAALEVREREKTGISSLKVRYNKVFGYYLEVTKANLHLVPAEYFRKQTTVGAERFVTPELKEYEEKVLTAEEKRGALEFQLFNELREQVVAQAAGLKAAADAVASLDVVLSLARCAVEYGYVRPMLDESDVLEIEAGRHPVVERMLAGERFVPNDIRLDGQKAQVQIITGPNMAGKSTVMRQVALTVVMAQAGSFVPAKRARIGLCDRVFTRVGASDNLARGQSTFMVEMSETANILHHATSKSLLVLDEIGRGTSTFDGLSIAWAVAEHLHNHIGARTLFATHYHELTDLTRECPRVKNCSISVKEQGGRIVFLRKLVEGAANRSYGIEVARLAGLPPEVVARARVLLQNLESGELDEAGRPRLATGSSAEKKEQLALFPSAPAPVGPEALVLEELRKTSCEALTPLEALNLLARLQKALRPS